VPLELKVILNQNHLKKRKYFVELEFRDYTDEFKYNEFNEVPEESWPTRKTFKFVYYTKNTKEQE